MGVLKNVGDADLHRFAAYGATRVGIDLVAWHLARAVEIEFGENGWTGTAAEARDFLRTVFPLCQNWTMKDLEVRIGKIASKRSGRANLRRVLSLRGCIDLWRLERYANLIQRHSPVQSVETPAGAKKVVYHTQFLAGVPMVDLGTVAGREYTGRVTIDRLWEIVEIKGAIYARRFRQTAAAKLVRGKGFPFAVWLPGVLTNEGFKMHFSNRIVE